jgi:hypothetical protein
MNNELKRIKLCTIACTNYKKAVFANIENQITDAIVGMKIVVIKTLL